MKEFYNSQTPPSEEPRSTSTNTLEILDTQAITGTTTVLNKIKVRINRGLITQVIIKVIILIIIIIIIFYL